MVQPQRFTKLKEVLSKRQPDLTVLMENVHKAHNFSAIVRTCDAVGVSKVHTVDPEDAVRTHNEVSKGSEKWVEIKTYQQVEKAIAHLQGENFQIYAAHLSDNSIDYRYIDYTKPTAILLGTERWGVSPAARQMADNHIMIPMMGMVASLNVSVAAAVILFEAQKQRIAAGYYQKRRLDDQTYRDRLFEWSYPKIAAMYQEKGEAYPSLDDQGMIQS